MLIGAETMCISKHSDCVKVKSQRNVSTLWTRHDLRMIGHDAIIVEIVQLPVGSNVDGAIARILLSMYEYFDTI